MPGMHVADPLSIKVLVVKLGGNRAVAERVGVRSQAVSNWIATNTVPREHHLALWEMALAAQAGWEPPGADSIRHLLGAAGQPAAKVA
jgi:hypothetical protein